MQKALQVTPEKGTNPHIELKQLQFKLDKTVEYAHTKVELGVRERFWTEFLADSIRSAQLGVVKIVIDEPLHMSIGTLDILSGGLTDFMFTDLIDLAETFPALEETHHDMERFERERETFPRIKNDLLERETYVGEFVAIHEGQVVDHDRDIIELSQRVYARYGYVPIYIDKVEREEKVIELPSPEG